MDIFVSVGTGLNPQQETFVSAVEDRLRAIGFTPCTIGRNTFSSEAPLRAVAELMDRCAGAVVIALERYHFDNGVERRGSAKEQAVGPVALPTPWNQIEAAMAYSRGLPLFVVVDDQLRCDGLLEKGNDWYVQELPIDPSALNSASFIGVLDNWRGRVSQRPQKLPSQPTGQPKADPATMTIAQLLGALKPAQLWAALVALAGAIGGAFYLGAKLSG